jgi:pimeloyl-ACP methyl ester carboxylesterase
VGVSAGRITVDVPGGRVAVALHLPESAEPVACVVACHGLNASKESDKYLMLGEAVPAAGFALARFDFRGCGESSGAEEETTIATRIEDAEAVLGFLKSHPRLSGRVGLLGSSLGGFVALQVAARASADIRAVVTWNAPSDLRRLGDESRADRTGIGAPLLEELATHRFATTPGGITRHLAIHGDRDDVVPPEHGAVLHSRAAAPCELLVIAGGDHRITDPEHRRRAIDASVAWFRRFLHAEGGLDE